MKKNKKKCACWYGYCKGDDAILHFILKGSSRFFKVTKNWGMFKYCPKCRRKL